MKSDSVTLSENTLTLNGTGKIETSNLVIQSGGRLVVSESLEVTGNLVAAQGSEVMIGFWRPPRPKPPGHIKARIGMTRPRPPRPLGDAMRDLRSPQLHESPDLERGLYDLTNYYQSEETVKLYSNYYDIPLGAIRNFFDDFMATDHTVCEVNSDGILSMTKSFGTTGADLVALGLRLPPPPKPRGGDPALITQSITFQSGSELNFSFEKGYAPEIGDMFLLANVPIQIGENVHSNLASGWVITNSIATVQYVGPPVS